MSISNSSSNRFKFNEVTNYDIDRYYKGNKRYGGCISREDVKKLDNKDKFYIVNLDDKDGVGTHWVGLYLDKPNVALYIDSFALDPPEEIVSFVKKNDRIGWRNLGQMQSMSSSACGWYCIYCLDHLLRAPSNGRGHTFLDAVSVFDSRDERDRLHNERILYNYFSNK